MSGRVWNNLAHFLVFPSIVAIEVPLNELHILCYIAYLPNASFSNPSIISQLSAISFWIKWKRWPLVTQSFAVSCALMGMRSI